MRVRSLLVALAAIAAGAAPASAGPAPADAGPPTLAVNIVFQSFTPAQLDALPGDTVRWSNPGERTHTVTANEGSFDSGDLSGGASFAHRFDAPGVYRYYCRIHRGMNGEVDVRRVTLEAPSGGPVPSGQRVTFAGRSADGSATVSVEQAVAGGYRTIASATPASDGRWSVTVLAPSSGEYRARSGEDLSETRKVLVVNRQALVRATRQGIEVTATPPDAGALAVLEVYLRERFGWWPVQRARLDYLSRAVFRLRGPVRVRVVVVDRDGWTPLFTSRVLRLPRSR